MDELDALENPLKPSRTKKEEQFKYAPLHPLFHKHFSSPRLFLRNLGDFWGLRGEGTQKLELLVADVAKKFGDNPDKWPGILMHRFVLDGYLSKAKKV